MAGGWAADAAVIVGYLALICWVGLRGRERETTFYEYALGRRSIPWWAVLGSIIAAETSAGTFIGTPGEGYATRSYAYIQLVIGTILARLIIAASFLGPYYRFHVYSVYEFLEKRFGPKTRHWASGLFLVTRTIASGTRLYIAAIVLVVAYRLISGAHPEPGQELGIYIAAIVALTALTTLYSAYGGIRGVIWTDLIQATLMVSAGVTVIAILWQSTPEHPLTEFGIEWGWKGSGWDALKGLLASDYTLLGALIGSTFTTMATHGTDQDMVQRMLTATDVKKSRRSLVLSGLMDFPVVWIFLTIGILLNVFYRAHPDPSLPAKTNEIFCHFILTQLPIGIRGMVIAGIFATAMGSLSAALNALATSFVRDWYLGMNPSHSEKRTLRTARLATFSFALAMILIASITAELVIAHPKSRVIPIVLGSFGYTYGSLLGIFLLGMFTRTRGSDRGNGLAMIVGFVFVAILSGLARPLIGQPAWLPEASFPWRIFLGSVATLAVAACFRSPDHSKMH